MIHRLLYSGESISVCRGIPFTCSALNKRSSFVVKSANTHNAIAMSDYHDLWRRADGNAPLPLAISARRRPEVTIHTVRREHGRVSADRVVTDHSTLTRLDTPCDRVSRRAHSYKWVSDDQVRGNTAARKLYPPGRKPILYKFPEKSPFLHQ